MNAITESLAQKPATSLPLNQGCAFESKEELIIESFTQSWVFVMPTAPPSGFGLAYKYLFCMTIKKQ